VPLLRITRQAIKQADPGARIVLGALTNLAWHSIGQIYAVKGARRLFDVVSINGFTATPSDVILYMQLMRRAMDRYGDATKPLIASELSWPSAQGQTAQHNDFNTTENGQARDIARLLPMIGAWRPRLGLRAFYYYTWMGNEFTGAPAFSFSGLTRLTPSGQVKTKPALGAFRRGALALERCRAAMGGKDPLPNQLPYFVRAEAWAANAEGDPPRAQRLLLEAAEKLSAMPIHAARLTYEAMRAGAPARRLTGELETLRQRCDARLLAAYAAHAAAHAAGDGQAGKSHLARRPDRLAQQYDTAARVAEGAEVFSGPCTLQPRHRTDSTRAGLDGSD